MRLYLLLFAAAAASLFGQTDIKGVIGSAGFLDDGSNHTHIGGAVRFYPVGRLGIEPEVAYLYESEAHNDTILAVNVSYDFRAAEKRVIPYVVGGAGVLAVRYRYPQFRSLDYEPLASGGGGAKIYVSRNWFVAPEFRIGFPPHGRFTVAVGYTFRR